MIVDHCSRWGARCATFIPRGGPAFIASRADVAAMLWRNVEAVEAAFALWSRARRVIERCGRAEAKR